MKISIVIAEGEKQIMMTPETDHERDALKFIAPTDKITVACQWGTYDDEPEHFAYNTSKCQGGHFRRFAEENSVMFIISDSPKPTKK